MAETPERSDANRAKILRQRADELARTSPADISNMAAEDLQRLVHELQVHQIELEIQNEELREAQLHLAHARDRYADLFDFAPVGYLTLDPHGQILDSNLMTGKMLGLARQKLQGAKLARFIDRDSQDAFHLHKDAVFSRDARQTCEIRIQRADGNARDVCLESIAFSVGDDRRCRTALIDITDLKVAELSLKMLNQELNHKVEERTKEIRFLAEAISNLGEGIMITDDDKHWQASRIVYANHAMCSISGYTVDELVGKTPSVVFGAKSRQLDVSAINLELAQGRPCRLDATYQRKDGSSFDAEVAISPMANQQGEREHLVSIWKDVTDRNRIKSRLYEEEQRFRSIFQHAAIGIAITDWHGNLELCNPAYCELLKCSEKELNGIHFASLIHPDDRERILIEIRRLTSGEVNHFHIDNRYLCKDGTAVRVRKVVSSLPNAFGVPTHLVALVSDVTEQKQTLQNLRESEERLKAILSTASDAIIVSDEQGNITIANRSTEQMFGYTHDELLGQNVRLLIPSPHREQHDDYIAQHRRTGEAGIIGVVREVVARRKDGSLFPVDLAISEVDHLGLNTGVMRDITQRKALEQHVLQIASDEQRRIGQELHDGVGQQLTGLGMMADTLLTCLRRKELPESRFAEKLASGLKHAVKEIRLLSRGLNPVEIDPLGLTTALAGLIQQCRELYGIPCKLEADELLHLYDSEVATQLFRITQEAINNAAKHANASQIGVRIHQIDGCIELSVSDNGIGIPNQRPQGMGLRTMGYRAGVIGARLKIMPGKEGGTIVICTLDNPVRVS